MPESTIKRVEVLVCPTPDCPHYYGASNMDAFLSRPNSGKGMNGEVLGPPSSRLLCPACKENGVEVERLRLAFEADVPAPPLDTSQMKPAA